MKKKRTAICMRVLKFVWMLERIQRSEGVKSTAEEFREWMCKEFDYHSKFNDFAATKQSYVMNYYLYDETFYQLGWPNDRNN